MLGLEGVAGRELGVGSGGVQGEGGWMLKEFSRFDMLFAILL